MQKQGRIITVDGGRATVCFEPAMVCENCAASHLCQAGKAQQTMLVENSMNAQVGDLVLVEQTSGKALLSAFLLFGLPVILALIGLSLSMRRGEVWALFCGIGGFALGLVIAKIINNMLARKSLILPRITEIVKKEGS
jgi:positive regulator of sigma E activity